MSSKSSGSTGERVQRWIRARLEEVPSASRFKFQVIGSESPEGETIFQMDVPKTFKSRELADEIALQGLEAAIGIAKSMSGMAKFAIYSYRAKRDEERRKVTHSFYSSTRFALKGQMAEEVGPIAESEMPDKKGVVSQLMRHLENKEQMMNGMVIALTEGVREENASLRRRNTELEEFQLTSRKKMEEMMTQTMERQIKFDDAAAARERKTVMVKKVTEEVIPALASHIPGIMERLGVGGGGGGAMPVKQLTAGDLARDKIRRIFIDLKEADRFWFLKKLSDDAGPPFLDLLTNDKIEVSMEQAIAIVRLAFFSLEEDDRFTAISKVPVDKQEELMQLLGR